MIRKLPPVCLILALTRMITGQLVLSNNLRGKEVEIEKGKAFVIFRNIKQKKASSNKEQAWFAVSFKFARLSHKANKLTSLIPMMIIAGYPGFMQKIYAVNPANGYWQGIYQWKSQAHLEAYKKSFVFRMMNKRAIKDTVSLYAVKDKNLQNYLQGNTSRMEKE